MNNDEIEHTPQWNKELDRRLERWWKAFGVEYSRELPKRKNWKPQPWIRPRQHFRASVRPLGRPVCPDYISFLCSDFTWRVSEWVRHTAILDIYPGERNMLELRLQVAQLQLCASYLKGPLRGLVYGFIDMAQGILREIDRHYSG